jgi:hypothetical protein
LLSCLESDHFIPGQGDCERMEIWCAIFCFGGKIFCYLWIHKKYSQPYLGIVEGKRFNHPALISEKRSRMKIMLFDPDKDLPIELINTILEQTIIFYKTGVIKTPGNKK